MYYSKNGQSTLNVPRNYSGNTFRVIDETERERAPKKEQLTNQANLNNEKSFINDEMFYTNNNEFDKKTVPVCESSNSKTTSPSLISSILSNISIEDLLLLGLIFVIHQDNPNDPILLLLLILLLAK